MSIDANISKKDYNKLKNAVRNQIRQAFSRSDHYKEFLELNRVEWLSGKRKRVSYKCAHCGQLFSKPDINVDHIIPIGKGTYNDISDAHAYFSLVYCSYDNLQILCKDKCHKVKTKREQSAPSFHNALF